MRSSPPFFWPFTCSIILLLSLCALVVSGKCLGSQQSLLLQLRNSLDFSSDYSTKLVNWNESLDCCSWEGVTCEEGRVTHLDLSDKRIYGGLDNSSTLFDLQHLKSLDLSDNEFNSTIPSRIGSLTNLSYLNLSSAGFWGEIPIDVSRLRNLVSLDLSSNLEIPNLTMLLHNLSKLQELYLDFANISAPGNRWCEALSSTVPNLQILSLSDCNVPGPLDKSLLELQSLSEISLDGINFSSPVPQFFAEFSSLTLLNLGYCGLQGTFPSGIFQVPTLQVIDISFNELLEGTLPEFPINNSLQELLLSSTKFSERLPASLGNLWNLSILDLSMCQFNSILPSSMSNLSQVAYIDPSSNNFTSPIPSFHLSTKLIHIDLSHNGLTGEIPLSLFALPSLATILLSNNQYAGPIPEFKMTSSLIDTLNFSHNNLEGLIPTSIFKLGRLSSLDLSYNKFNGTNLKMFQGSSNLDIIDLSCINIKFFPDLLNLPELTYLNLSYNGLKMFPRLENLSMLKKLDLSYNQISGEIPKWISEVGKFNLNACVREKPCVPKSLALLDLSFNQLQGKIPLLPQFLSYLDLSSNNLTSLPYDDLDDFSWIRFMSLSNNSLTGVIPEGICVAKMLFGLDLSHNNLSGRIPKCLIENSNSYPLLNLGENNFEGPIPDVFPRGCQLTALYLHENFIEREIPKSLSNCIQLEVLNLGQNELIGEFPCSLKNISTLHVLILRSNKLFGGIDCIDGANGSWPMLQIFDVAHNNFTGDLPRRWLTKLQGMMADENGVRSEVLSLDHKAGNIYGRSQPYIGSNVDIFYVYSVLVTSKGSEMELPKILTIFNCMDLSSNNFLGQIPDEIGQLKALYVLNLSYNAFEGHIPASIGNLRHLESLDLSSNNLSGTIPTQLHSLSFLEFLNLSFNQLVGKIPVGGQLDTFSEDSYIGNRGLYGCPLIKYCSHHKGVVESATKGSDSNSGRKIDWNLITAEMGLFTGFGLVVSPLVFSRRWRVWYYERVDDIIIKIFPLAVSRKWFLWTST